ncbi:MAG: sensor histidine kinase [Promethearchaeota archaeon]
MPFKKVKRIWITIELLLVFFTCGYAINIISQIFGINVINQIFISFVYFFVALFCLIVIHHAFITYRKLLESYDKQKVLLNELLKTSKITSILLSGITHEFYTPLNAIIGFTELLLQLDSDNLEDYQVEYLENIHSSALSLQHMVKSVLDIQDVDSGQVIPKIEALNIKYLVKEVVEKYEKFIRKKGLTLKIENLDEDKIVNADKKHLEIIISNLVSNAVNFTENGQITIKYKEDKSTFSISATDAGSGIKPEDQHKVFLEFKRIYESSDPMPDGAGLGLPFVKRLVQLNNGTIKFKSKVGEGSKFTVIMPR